MGIVINGEQREDGKFPLQLTAGKPHTLITSPGVGRLSLGPRTMGKKVDLWVEADEAIHWPCFDPFATMAGSPWPRHLDYWGNDSGFFAWSTKREIEGFTWKPALPHDLKVDASLSRIDTLSLHLPADGAGRLHLRLPSTSPGRISRLSLHGTLHKAQFSGGLPQYLSLSPATSKRSSDEPVQLPDLGTLQQITHLELCNGAGKQPISLRCLHQFPHLTSLSIWGHCVDLQELAALQGLTTLQLRFMPHLTGLPALDHWPQLESLIAYNVEEAAGKRLRQQMKALEKLRPWAEYSSVTQLRKPEWWTKEYGRPFAGWPATRAKQANAAYDTAELALRSATQRQQAQAAIEAFTVRFNNVKGIETTEREDLGEAVWQLAQLPEAQVLGVTEELAQQWFDAVRDY